MFYLTYLVNLRYFFIAKQGQHRERCRTESLCDPNNFRRPENSLFFVNLHDEQKTAPFARVRKKVLNTVFVEKPSHSFREPQWHEVVTTTKWLFQIAGATPPLRSYSGSKAFGVDVDKKWPIKATHSGRRTFF